MREMVFGLLVASGLGAGVFLWPAGEVAGKVYALSPAQAVQRLMVAPTAAGTPFFGRDVTAASAGTDYVEFVSEDGVVACKADIVPEDDGIMVDASCGNSPFAGPADHPSGDWDEIAFAEFVDAALERRPFNAAAVNAKAIGSMLESLPTQEEMLESQREMKQAAEDYEFYGGYSEDQSPPTEEAFYE